MRKVNGESTNHIQWTFLHFVRDLPCRLKGEKHVQMVDAVAEDGQSLFVLVWVRKK